MEESNPGPAYDFHRSERPETRRGTASLATTEDSIYSAPDDSSAGGVTMGTEEASVPQFKDATETVHEMHLALLHLLSNPEEFQKALVDPQHADQSTLSAWDDEYNVDEDEETVEGHGSKPLPYVVFTEDAEVVLPQAHTASQLFGIERAGGIELEAAAGIPALSQLFLRWLALMPGGDHLNIIDPPGLTVMRIAGGRYRVTAAHRAVWTWMNEFSPEAMPSYGSTPSSPGEGDELPFGFGDLVTMTIVDVFETDSDGKLLSYCPTFDNRAIRKTTQATERIRKGSSQIKTQLNVVAKSQTAARVNKAAGMLGRMSIKAAVSVRDSVKKKIDEELHKSKSEGSSPTKEDAIPTSPTAAANTSATAAVEPIVEKESEEESVPRDGDQAKGSGQNGQGRGDLYFSDDSTSVDDR